MSGWIKLHRNLLDNPAVCKDADHIAVWIYLLLNATHKQYDIMIGGKRVTLQPGQLVTSRKSLADELKVSESKAERILKLFKIEQQIEQQSFSTNRIISVLNWHKYQESEQQNEQQVNSDRTASEQRVNTNKNIRIKEQENERSKDQENSPPESPKGERTRFTPPTLEDVISYCKERQNNVDADRWYDFYSSKGWMVGRNKMKDWRAAVRTWEKNSQSSSATGRPSRGYSSKPSMPVVQSQGQAPTVTDEERQKMRDLAKRLKEGVPTEPILPT